MQKLALLSLMSLLAVPVIADAKPKKKVKKKQEATVKTENVSGQCSPTGETTRECFVKGSSAELHLNISKNYPLIVTFDEAPDFAYADPYIQGEANGNFILFRLKGGRLPRNHNLLVRTQTMTLTLYFHEKTKGDSQVHIKKADRANVDAEVARRVAEAEEALKADYKKQLNALDERASQLARTHFLEEFVASGSDQGTPGGQIRARNDFLVLRALKAVRIGNERMLQVTVQERKGDAFTIGNIRTSLTQGDTGRELDSDFRCASLAVRPGATTDCYISLGSVSAKRGKAKVQVTVEGAAGQRSVTLSGVSLH